MIDERRPQLFLTLVALSSIPFFVLGAVTGEIQLGTMRLPASAAMFMIPVAVAVALTWRYSGAAAVPGLLRRAVDRPAAALRWYVLAVLLPVALAVVSAAAVCWTGQAGWRLPLSPAAAPGLVLVFLIAATCEELGWTGYAIEPLQQRFGMLPAALGLGVYWALWHLIPLVEAGHPVGWIAGWFLGAVAIRVLIVWLHDRTGHGVSAAILMHVSFNVTAAYTPGLDRPISVITTGVLTAALTAGLMWGSTSRTPRAIDALTH
ncbi:CPBP family intramembrane glutamic endopeptidase [Nocardia sp. NPDC005746]|uniref:CPBP family intramembrane glutamic endopeptidase n=1 Tax=Nocardia sp. NPDC005746 TaxID=3157062 RepID=UPI0033E0EAA8